MRRFRYASVFPFMLAVGLFWLLPNASAKIVHDSEYYILQAQNGEKWAADDKTVDQKTNP